MKKNLYSLPSAFVPLTNDGGDVLKISKSEVLAMLEAMRDDDEIRAALIELLPAMRHSLARVRGKGEGE